MHEPNHDWGFLVIALVVAGLCLTETEGRRWFRIVGFWAISGLALNLLVYEEWYPVYFALPVILLLGGCAAAARRPVARKLATAAILAGILGNFLQISILHGNEYLTWKEYREYSSAISAKNSSRIERAFGGDSRSLLRDAGGRQGIQLPRVCTYRSSCR